MVWSKNTIWRSFFVKNVLNSDTPFTRHVFAWHQHQPIKDNKSNFSVQIHALEPGIYEIGPHNFRYSGSRTTHRYGYKTNKFTVPAGKFIYLGEVQIELKTVKRKTGLSKGSDAITGIKKISINNKLKRDIEVAKKIYPNMNFENIEVKLMKKIQ